MSTTMTAVGQDYKKTIENLLDAVFIEAEELVESEELEVGTDFTRMPTNLVVKPAENFGDRGVEVPRSDDLSL